MSIFVAPVRQSLSSRKANQSASDEATNEDPRISANDESPEDYTEQEGADDSDTDSDIDQEQDQTNEEYKTVRPGKHRSLRHQHLDVLVTLLHKSVLDADWARAERAYALLLRSKGVDIRLCHDLGLQILEHVDTTGTRSMEFMARLIVAYPPLKDRKGKRRYDRADVFVQILAELRMKHKQYRTALQELEGWLLVPPYKDDRILWDALIRICEILEDEAVKVDDKLEAHRHKQRRLRAVERLADMDT